MRAPTQQPLVRLLTLAVTLILAATLTGCATVPEASRDQRDPLESVNRGVYAFNDSIDKSVLRPVARGYKAVVPQPVQTGVSNFFANAKYPVTLVNNLLQGKFKAAISDTARFTLNSTLGLGGLLDPATAAGLDVNDEDFGQTLGKWGVPPGPYLVLPLLGPYTVRDGIGSLADDFAEPRAYIEEDRTRWSLWAADRFDRRVRLLEAEALLDRAGDPYAFVRSAYLQRREYLVRDGDVPVEDLELEMESEPDEDDTAVTPDTVATPDRAVSPDTALTPQGAAASPLR